MDNGFESASDFDTFYAGCRNVIVSHVLHMSNFDRHYAEDIAQEVGLKLWKQWQKQPLTEYVLNVRAYLKRVARNCCAANTRTRQAFENAIVHLLGEGEIHDPRFDADPANSLSDNPQLDACLEKISRYRGQMPDRLIRVAEIALTCAADKEKAARLLGISLQSFAQCLKEIRRWHIEHDEKQCHWNNIFGMILYGTWCSSEAAAYFTGRMSLELAEYQDYVQSIIPSYRILEPNSDRSFSYLFEPSFETTHATWRVLNLKHPLASIAANNSCHMPGRTVAELNSQVAMIFIARTLKEATHSPACHASEYLLQYFKDHEPGLSRLLHSQLAEIAGLARTFPYRRGVTVRFNGDRILPDSSNPGVRRMSTRCSNPRLS